MAVAMTGISIPNFVMAPLLILVFAVLLGWLPAGGYGEGDWRNLVLPVVTLALPQIAYLARLTRASMIEVLRSDLHPHRPRPGPATAHHRRCATR